MATTRTRNRKSGNDTKLKVVEQPTQAAPRTATKTATKQAATRTRKTAAPKAASKPTAQPKNTDAAKPSTTAADPSSRAVKARDTHAAAVASGEQRTCEGQCGNTMPITKFPTTSKNKDGVMGRGKVCRACRDAKRANKNAA